MTVVGERTVCQAGAQAEGIWGFSAGPWFAQLAEFSAIGYPSRAAPSTCPCREQVWP